MKLVLLTKKYPKLNDVIRNYIISHPEKINKVNEKGWSALNLAAINSRVSSSIETVKLLLDNGADTDIPNIDGSTPLMHASIQAFNSSNIETVQLLLNYNARTCMQDKRGVTALMFAVICSGDSLEVLKLLLKNDNSAVNIRDKNGVTALMHAASYNLPNSNEVIKLLLENTANVPAMVNIQDNKGNTALYYATPTSNIENIKLLLRNGANVNIINNKGESIIELACRVNIIKLLLEYDAVNYQGRTANNILLLNRKN